MVDAAKVEQMLARLQAFHAVLAEIGSTPRDALLADAHRLGNAKYHFVVAIECAIDIANHIVASEGLRMPQSNADAFAVLGEAGVVAHDAVPSLRAMARFRNRLVHMYWDVDDAMVVAYLTDGLADLQGFATAIGRFMQRQGDV